MRKFSSILPLNSRLANVDLSATGPRRKGAYDPITSNSASKSRSQRLENSGRIKMDKVSISEESKQAQNSPQRETVGQIYRRLEGFKY